jgi:thiamine biosynthesis lipoprotein
MLVVAVASVALASCAGDRGRRALSFGGATMGTTFRVSVDELPANVSLATLDREVAAILDRIEDRMSTYDEASEVSRFNAARTTEWVDMSAETVAVVDEALRISALTRGAFDITVGPLVGLWGFGPAGRSPSLPSDDAIASALERVGYGWLGTRRVPPALRKARPDVEVDLSAIAPGYAADQVAEHLQATRVSSFLVEVGGEVRATGRSPEGTPWRIGVEMPVRGPRRVQRVLLLADRAVATSGGYRSFFEAEGRRFSHTIDPRTGRPVSHNLVSVSVVDASTMRADALATGLNVLGPEEGRTLAQREGLAVLFILRDGDDLREQPTPAIVSVLEDRRVAGW